MLKIRVRYTMSYDIFLKIMKNGWEGTIECSENSLHDPSISTLYSRIRMNPFDALAVDRLAHKINVNFRVDNNGIVIHQTSHKNKQMKIIWENIINVYNTKITSEILIKVVDGNELIITPPFVKRFFLKHYFVNEFISYINNHVLKNKS
ncbi:hypothetical protein [Methanobrevibacter arboriphilus]|uniref:Uncharacterized protein n=2 Tax=Methanobrevibacter arboriphilus TaxID=39441 RepID=A0ACA8R2Q9_METAZ|nr:hypothetical protein [Methanobrevibacter arboriphilus]BBL61432.1 hypothetical protein MarbSA_04720 [Methanobrevibacter arboriphilus]